MKTHKVAFQLSKEAKFSQFSAELQRKLKFSCNNLENSTKSENAIENLNLVSFLNWVAKKAQKTEFMLCQTCITAESALFEDF